jgi:hypothetical protein
MELMVYGEKHTFDFCPQIVFKGDEVSALYEELISSGKENVVQMVKSENGESLLKWEV